MPSDFLQFKKAHNLQALPMRTKSHPAYCGAALSNTDPRGTPDKPPARAGPKQTEERLGRNRDDAGSRRSPETSQNSYSQKMESSASIHKEQGMKWGNTPTSRKEVSGSWLKSLKKDKRRKKQQYNRKYHLKTAKYLKVFSFTSGKQESRKESRRAAKDWSYLL